IDIYIIELGTEGRLISMQLAELVSGVDMEEIWLIKDYAKDPSDRNVQEIRNQLRELEKGELLDTQHLVRLLGYPSNMADELISPRGYRMLHKIPRLPSVIISNLVEKFGTLPRIMAATIEELDEVDGIGEVRARAIKEGLKRIQEQVFIDRHI